MPNPHLDLKLHNYNMIFTGSKIHCGISYSEFHLSIVNIHKKKKPLRYWGRGLKSSIQIFFSNYSQVAVKGHSLARILSALSFDVASTSPSQLMLPLLSWQ